MPLPKKRPSFNAAPGIGWLLVPPLAALAALAYFFPTEMRLTVLDWIAQIKK